LLSVPIDKIEELSQFDFVEWIEIATQPKPLLDRALPSSNVDKVHQGLDLERSYTGKGVIIGVGDWGFDFTHPMFSDTNGVSRVKRAWVTQFTGSGGIPPEGFDDGHLYTDSNQIKTQVRHTSTNQSHGAHVAGIVAGTPIKAQIGTYSGIAKDADIIVVDLSDATMHIDLALTVLEATAYMFRYADSVGKPISINYSLGVSNMLHAGDGESLADIALSELLQENPEGKIVTVAAGNEGRNTHAKADLQNNDSFFVNIPFDNSNRLSLEIWGEVNSPFTVDLYYKNGSQQILYASYNTSNEELISGSKSVPGTNITYNMSGLVAPDDIFSYGNRHFAFLTINKQGSNQQPPDSCYLVIKGSNTSINIFNESGTTFSVPMSSNVVHGNHSSIRSPGTVEEVITVGAYATRIDGPYAIQNPNSIMSVETKGDIAPFSSRGPLTNGRIKPDITAPGAEIVSAKNNFATNYDKYIFDSTDCNNHYFASVSGTSMATPMVTGIVALMLEINPQLTHTEVKDILRVTAINDQWTGDAKNNKCPTWGWGKINAHAIMKNLETNSIEDFDNTISFTVYPNPVVNNEITISIFDVVCDLPFVVRIYDQTGKLVFLSSMQDTKTFDISRLASGFYIVKIDNSKRSAGAKIVVGG